MTTQLLDVNLLIALAWPNHIQHRAAHRWFAQRPDRPWATCPMTQCGFVRISSNPKIIADAVTPTQAIEALGQIVANPRHVFWPDSIGIGDLDHLLPDLLMTGHRQVTDAYLLALAIQHDGQIATMDKGVIALAGKAKSQHVELLDSRLMGD